MLSFYLSLLDTPEEKSEFEQLYKDYKDTMYNNAYNILHDKYLAEDAVHNAFMAAIKSSKKIYKMNCNEKRCYLLIINRNAAYALYKEANETMSIDELESMAVSSENIELDFEVSEDTKKVFDIVKGFGRNYSDVLFLKLFYGLDDEEIAAALGITVENARVRIFRGKNKLKEMLKKENDK